MNDYFDDYIITLKSFDGFHDFFRGIQRERRYLSYVVQHWTKLARSYFFSRQRSLTMTIAAPQTSSTESSTMTLCNVRRVLQELGVERSTVLLDSLLSTSTNVAKTLSQHLSGNTISVDENVMSIKREAGHCMSEVYTHAYVHHSWKSSTRLPGNTDVYLHFPIRCQESGQTGILCIQGQLTQLPSVTNTTDMSNDEW